MCAPARCRQQITVKVVLGPTVPSAFEKFQVRRAVNALDRREAEILWRLYRAYCAGLDPIQHMVGPGRHFEAGHQLAVHQLAASVVQVVIV
jgi:hypothetical protein